MSENLQNIIYTENAKNDILERYKKDRLTPLRVHTLTTVIKNLLKYARSYNLELRKIIISTILYQMSSNQYIESKIDWSEYNNLNVMISDLSNDIEDDIYEDYYKNSFCYKYFGIKMEC